MDQDLVDRLRLEEATEGFRNGVPVSVGVLILNSFHAKHAMWNPPTGNRFRSIKHIVDDWKKEQATVPKSSTENLRESSPGSPRQRLTSPQEIYNRGNGRDKNMSTKSSIVYDRMSVLGSPYAIKQ